MQHDDTKYLWDVYDAASFLIEDNADITYESFVADRRRLSSALHLLLVIGEACRQIRDHFPDTAHRIPELNAAIGMRNIIAHQYSDVDYKLVWQTIEFSLPPLRDRVFALYEETK